ncbi:hypothetical protein COV61_03890 [Candidatus Micrarchaeota archaeon CG11_big_fil_rev_8_21_14_0_20_47_5]|nr:MAG: hypothetical protein AUJ17_01880 [Candidatus Micrarchaeota archaeon CG1_02_47_40]PIN83169.1 MAG: hypothetical protein COV61_03890 [Candidatus Micrarchaeota archaeon CG11_big_fil_rev_8_21_14_0_20_47_5]
MEIVADTNIVVAAILRSGLTRKLLFRNEIRVFSPENLRLELEEHAAEFIKKSGFDEDTYQKVVNIVLSKVSEVPFEEYGRFEEEARKVSPDAEDWPFFAVALQKQCALWSNEKRLKKQERVAVYNAE